MTTDIKSLRRSIGLSARELAFMLGVSTAVIYTWENRKCPEHRMADILELIDNKSFEAMHRQAKEQIEAQKLAVTPSENAVKLREMRTKAGIPVHKLASAMGMSNTTIFGWETGRARMSDKNFAAAKKALKKIPPPVKNKPAGPIPNPSGITNSQKIFAMRTNKGLTRKELASLMGCSSSLIYQWETSRLNPVDESVARVAKALNCYFFGGADCTEDTPLPMRVKMLRLRAGMTKKEVAECLGVNPVTITKWEEAKNTPSRRLLVAFQELFNIRCPELDNINYQKPANLETVFGRKLTALRKDRKLTQVQLGRLMDVDDTSISAWELGKHLPDEHTIKILCGIFGVTRECLFGLEEHKMRRWADKHGEPLKRALKKAENPLIFEEFEYARQITPGQI